ncbi:class I SAM-dependent methyltransferase [Haliangium ochraceum]|uniref:Methyltransferase type 11 n=1 Tax=Haliangium ochraceum (strain DSM 14365 / JCM 11303 / SMP-2) TaxID=502025 RepID=D0LHD7_HALO1|nr:class I SAM-dependent methyltransferase [Haliangium ochraceum]ACY18282.1 Methyltransferase type 11 [Haliangium ochraceum DSM 14365]
MSEHPAASDWAAARGEKWRANLPRMEAMLRPVDEPLIRALHLDAPRRIADIGCGGGGTTLELARRAPAGSVVHGFDISPALVDSARERAQREDCAARFELADVGQAPAPQQPYERLLSRFGTMFYSDPPAAFGNLLRWLVPGGRFAFAVWGPMEDNPWVASIREVVAEVIELPPMVPDAPGPFRYAGADSLLALLEQAGFAELAVDDWHGTLKLGGGMTASEAAHFALTSFSIGTALMQAGEQAFADGHRALSERLSQYQRDGAVALQARVHLVTGARPDA